MITPSLEREGFDALKSKLRQDTCYIEYGVGGSTVLAAKQITTGAIFAVDTSSEWIEKVKKETQDTSAVLRITHCNFGSVQGWGTPETNDHFADYWQYMQMPWLASKYYPPVSLVLVDGRFRVASFLFSLISAKPGTTILFDDYATRQRYHVVEDFCNVHKYHKRMAEFIVPDVKVTPELAATIAEYSVNFE